MSASSTPISRVRQWASPSMKQKGAPPASSAPLLASFPGNDDELERRQRRRSRVIDLQAASDTSFNDSACHRYGTCHVLLQSNPLSYMLTGDTRIQTFVNPMFKFSVTGTPAAVPKMSNAQISEHYSTCIKLSTENVSRHANAY